MPAKRVLRYTDALSRFLDNNPAGKKLLLTHITQATEENLAVRLVIVSTKDSARVDAGEDASNLSKIPSPNPSPPKRGRGEYEAIDTRCC